MIANHGQKVKYHHDIIGINSRLDTLQAAILTVKLNYIDDYTSKRNEVAAYYDNTIKEVNGLVLPHRASNSTHVFHQYTIKVDGKRNGLREHLTAAGIPTMIYYPIPLHLQNAYRQKEFGEGSFPVTERLSKSVLSLPIHTEMTKDQLEFISTTILRFFEK
jgi:dTDP-4-amino-4,6-dideoxygalactose transaminase